MVKKIISAFTIINFLIIGIYPYENVFAQENLYLPPVGQILPLSPEFNPLLIKGIKIHKDDPFKFDFIVNKGQENLTEKQFNAASLKLVKYFLASLTIPEDDLWVNLSPYEKNRIITPELGVTEMGKDLLSQDYVLKQLTSSLIYPEGETGKKFWAKVYALAEQRYHTTNIPINTFNKVWIIPQKAVVYENSTSQTAYVIESKLKVLLEEDYLALQKHSALSGSAYSSAPKDLGSQIVREIVIPELTKEVNYGRNFASLRQVTNSLILAAWFKRALKASILAKLYVDQKKINGLDLKDRTVSDRIYQQYLRAYKKGVYNYIKEETDPVSHELVPRKYFSGGVVEKFKVGDNLTIQNTFDPAQLSGESNDRAVTVQLDRAMSVDEQKKAIFSPLMGLTEVNLKQFGEVIDSADKQRRFAQKYEEGVQAWFDLNKDRILNFIPDLDKPEPDERYRRNMILPPIKTPLGQIALFIHITNPLKGVPPHFHGDNEAGGFAWILPLNANFVEEKWLGLPTHRGSKVIELHQADMVFRHAGVIYHLVDDDGPHIMINTSISHYGAFLELYILPPNGIKGFDIPVPQVTPDNHINSIIPAVNANRLLTYDNFGVAAQNGGWFNVSNKDVDTIDYILHNPEAVVFQVVQGLNVVIPQDRLDRNFLKNAALILRDPEQPRLFFVFDAAMTAAPRIATREELLDPKRTLITADGITRDGAYDFGQQDLPQGPVDVVIIGAGAAGLATGIQAVDHDLKTVVLEGGFIAQSFSDAFMNFWRMRTPAFRFSLVQKGFDSSRLQDLNLSNPDVLSGFRKLALEAAQEVRRTLNKDFSIAQPAGYDNPANATVPLARAEAFEHFISVANAIVQRGGLIRENDPVVSVNKRQDGLYLVRTSKGLTVLAKNIVYATGLGNERVAEILNSVLKDGPDKYQSISNPGEIPAKGVDRTKLPLLNSQVLNDPLIVEFIQSLPPGSSIGVIGGGQSAGNSVAFVHSIRPDVVVHLFTRSALKVHGSQMPAGFRKAHLMWEYVNDEVLRRESWSKGGPEAVDTPITPPIFNHINTSIENGTTIVHVLGKYFDPDNYVIQTEGQTAVVIDKETDKQIAVIEHGGFISAVGFTLKSPERNALYHDAEANGLIQLNSKGIITVDPKNGLTSTLDPHIYPAGVQLLSEGAVTDGSTHGTVVRARAIVESIINGKTPRLSDDKRLMNAEEDYAYFLHFLGDLPDKETVAAFLTLAKSQAGESLESVISKYKRALEANTPLQAARATADVAGQTGKDIVKGSVYQAPENASKEGIVDRVFATDIPGLLENQDGKNKIAQVFDEIFLNKTGGDYLAAEQLLYPAAEYGVGKEKAFKLYDDLSRSYSPLVSSIMTRAATSYLPLTERISDPGGIDLNTANLDLQIKHDGRGLALPAEYQELKSIHINGLSPIIVNVAPITNLSEFLKV